MKKEEKDEIPKEKEVQINVYHSIQINPQEMFYMKPKEDKNDQVKDENPNIIEQINQEKKEEVMQINTGNYTPTGCIDSVRNEEEIARKRAWNPIPDYNKDTAEAFEKRKLKEEVLKSFHIRNMLHAKSEINAVFIMDCTQSMRPWIKEMKDKIREIVTYILQLYKSTVKIGFLGYRDFGDDDQFVKHDLTDNIEFLAKELQDIEAEGGGDEAENVSGALEQAQSLNFCKEGVNLIFLIGDSPCHGKQYYDENDKEITDNFRDFIPEGSLENIAKDLDKKVPNLQFICLRLHKSTEKMYSVLKENMKNCEVTENLVPTQFFQTVKSSILNTVRKHGLFVRKIEELKQSEMQQNEEPDSESFKARRLTYILPPIPKNIDTYEQLLFELYNKTRIQEKIVKISIQREMIGKGQESNVYQLYEGDHNKESRKMVAKLPIDLNTNSKDHCISRVKQQILASLIARLYNKKASEIDEILPLFYPLPVVYEIQDDSGFRDCKFIYAEPDLSITEQTWKRYGNNMFFLGNQELAVFSHFSYIVSEEKLLITDLQGCQVLLSDPCIHTYDIKPYYIDDPTNLQQGGIAGFFFFQHKQCDGLCKKMGIVRDPVKEAEIMVLLPEQKEEMKHVDTVDLEIKQEKSILMICELCSGFDSILKDEYRHKMKSDGQQEMLLNLFLCTVCQKKANKNENIKISKCKHCQDEFPFNTYINKLYSNEMPEYCPDCMKIINYQCKGCSKDVFIERRKAYVRKDNKQILTICEDCYSQDVEKSCDNCDKQFYLTKHDWEKFIDYDKYLCNACFKKMSSKNKQCKGKYNAQKVRCEQYITKLEMFLKGRPGIPYCDKCNKIREQSLKDDKNGEEKKIDNYF